MFIVQTVFLSGTSSGFPSQIVLVVCFQRSTSFNCPLPILPLSCRAARSTISLVHSVNNSAAFYKAIACFRFGKNFAHELCSSCSTNAFTIPGGRAQHMQTERFPSLPSALLCYQVNKKISIWPQQLFHVNIENMCSLYFIQPSCFGY